MKITAESTEQITDLDGVPVRVWRARTEHGVDCLLFVHRVAVATEQDTAAFDRELRAEPAPKLTPLAHVFDPRMF